LTRQSIAFPKKMDTRVKPAYDTKNNRKGPRRKNMSDRLKGKRAFVTAAAVGIGRACAVAFAREGATVFATDLDESKLAALKSEGIAEVAKLDARDSAAVAAMAKRAGKTDILLNAAGFVHHGTVLECSDEDWDFSFESTARPRPRSRR
jgi:2-keto-3-deoxy-L-fuconate dehydrogenase